MLKDKRGEILENNLLKKNRRYKLIYLNWKVENYNR
jgi:hypothetical protein